MDIEEPTNVKPETEPAVPPTATEPPAVSETAGPDETRVSDATPATTPEPEPDTKPETTEDEPSMSTGIDVEEVEDFGKALEAWEAGSKPIKEGEVVSGRILRVLEKEVIVDIGYKSEGVIDISEFRTLGGTTEVSVGDRVDVLLERTEDSDGYVVLSKDKAEKLKIWDVVESAYQSGDAITGRVVNRIKGGLKVDIGLPAFLPGSLVDIRPARNLESYIGQEIRMRVIKVNKRRGNIVLSRKAVLEVENSAKKKKTLEELEDGKILRGVVKNLTEYGVFIDLGGIDGLLHITDISWGRISHPSEKFQIGDELDVIVLKFDREKERVSLGFKQLQDDPWERAGDKYPSHSRIRGKVVSLTDYGAFFEVEEGIDGLVHISDLSWTKRIKHPSEVLTKGDEVSAVILKIDSENQRLSLGIKQLQPNVLDEFFQTHSTGDVLTGSIVRLTEFGAFVALFEGVEGLVHVSELSTDRIEKPEDRFEVGQEVRVKVIKLDPVEKKIGLSIKAAIGEPDTAAVQAYFDTDSGDGSATLGDLMDPSVFKKDAAQTKEDSTDTATPDSDPAGEATQADAVTGADPEATSADEGQDPVSAEQPTAEPTADVQDEPEGEKPS